MSNPHESPTFGNSLSLRVDGAIGAMSLSPNGRDAVLAGRRGLFIIDLDDPFTTPRWLHHITSWEVADVQWSPNQAKPSWCISTSNQKALLWDLARPSTNAIVNVLHGHTRAITDINFHPSNPEVLATCSIDSFVLSWDMRTPRKPVAKWAEWRAGATQVKWNHENPYEIASSHDNAFFVWDSRKGSLPIIKVEKAHNGKINGLDFSNGSSNIITCSNDKKVKFWNLKSDKLETSKSSDFFEHSLASTSLKPTVVINAGYPVARARSLPFGTDKACGIMPLRGGQDAIHIINYDSAYQTALETDDTQEIIGEAIHLFKGHNGPMKDFLWRTRHENYAGFETKNKWKDYQLVTWSSSDYDLKLWSHDEDLYKQVNYNPSYNRMLSLFKNGDSDEDNSIPSSPTKESGSRTPIARTYNTYCIEPPVSLEDMKRRNNGDVLSSMALFKIAEKHSQNGHHLNQLNHLDWISGVRIGRAGHDHKTTDYEEDGPSNLGEEVSIVGHKFPKVRFEKISVSTGELVISLRGPAPVQKQETEVEDDNSEKDVNVSVADKNRSSIANNSTTSNEVEVADDEINNTVNSNINSNVTSNTNNNLNNEDQEKLVFIRILIKFPKAYPYLEDKKELGGKSSAKFQKMNSVVFDIEETHELTSTLRMEMLRNLNEIAHFFTNRYKRFCLEPCLRYLMGDKLELDDELMKEDVQIDNTDDNIDGEIEVGNEGWADDLINQQPDYHETMKDDSSCEEDLEYPDLMPGVGSNDLLQSTDSLKKSKSSSEDDTEAAKTFFDSTPVPKGCGASWSPTGQLVCFFIPKHEEDDNKTKQKFDIFKFTDFSLNSHHHHNSDHSDTYSESSHEEYEEDYAELEMANSTTSSSNDSFANDWDEVLQDDAPARARIPGLFKTSVGLGNRYISKQEDSIKRLASHGGSASNYKSSNPGETWKRKKEKKNKNIVGIFDFSHLLPDKYELACEYRVLGDNPENLARYNGEVALKYGLKEISDVWKILEMVLVKDIQPENINPGFFFSPSMDPNWRNIRNSEVLNQLVHTSEATKKFGQKKTHQFHWGTHPFGHTWLVDEIFEYFERKGNIQMLAMISCILYENTINMRNNESDLFNVPIHTPYNALPPAPSVVAMKKFNDSRLFPRSDQFNLSFHESFSTDNRGALEYVNSNHRNSSISVLRKDQSSITGGYYAKSVSSSLDVGSIKDGSPERYVNKKNVPSSTSAVASLNDKYAAPASYSKTPKQKRKLEKPKNIQPKSTVKSKARVPPTVSIEMQNAVELDLFEDTYRRPLLQSQDQDKIASYREQYANMLFLWGLPINRIKILKFNYPEDKKVENYHSPFEVHRCHFGIKTKRRQTHNQPFISSVTSVATSKNNAWNTSKRNVFKYCVLCNLSVYKNLVVCTNCEHVLHSDCASEWWAQNQDVDPECPSGCGCNCLEHTI